MSDIAHVVFIWHEQRINKTVQREPLSIKGTCYTGNIIHLCFYSNDQYKRRQ